MAHPIVAVIRGGSLKPSPAARCGLSAPGQTRSRRHGAFLCRAVAYSHQSAPPPHPAESALLRLGLSQGASEQDVKRAYRKLALKFHPDICKEDSCTSSFMQINDAYEVIMDCLQGNIAKALAMESSHAEPMMTIYGDDDVEEWEEWMGWEGAGTLDYSNHINQDV